MVDYFKRKKQIQELMGAKGVDAMLIAGAENYYYITGDYRRQARMLFYRDADPTLIVFHPEVEQVRARMGVDDVRGWSSANELMQNFVTAMKAHDLRKATVGFDTHTSSRIRSISFQKAQSRHHHGRERRYHERAAHGQVS
jgi:Xaa-Pro aminopeptidase